MKTSQLRRLVPFIAAVLFMASMALSETPAMQFYDGADKLYHWIGFSFVSFAAHIAFPRVKLNALFLWILIGSASIELLQALSPSRTPSLADLIMNIVGIMTGLAAATLRPAEQPEKRRRRRQTSAKRSEISDHARGALQGQERS